MDMKEVLQEVSHFIEELSGYTTVVAPVKANIPRSYATLTPLSFSSLTQGKTYLDLQENLMREWQITFTSRLDFFTNDISKIEEVHSQLMRISFPSSSLILQEVSELVPSSSLFEGISETSFNFQITLRATLTSFVEEGAPTIQTIVVKEV